MRLFPVVDGKIDRFDRVRWSLSPFDISWAAAPLAAQVDPAMTDVAPLDAYDSRTLPDDDPLGTCPAMTNVEAL